MFVNLYQLRYCAAMIQICIFLSCNRDMDVYDVMAWGPAAKEMRRLLLEANDVIKPVNSTCRVVPP